jgi:hypothetical protein
MAASTRSLLPEHPVIEVVIYGTFSNSDAETARDEAWALSDALGIHNVLLEMSGTTQTPSAAEIVIFAQGMTSFGDPARLRNAVVRPSDLIPATWTGLYVTALVNRGLAAAEFRSRADAIDWLTSP